MEFIIADLINNPKIPKWLCYVIVTVATGFVIFIGVMPIVKRPMICGKIFGGVLAALFVLNSIFLYVKIAKSKKLNRKKAKHPTRTKLKKRIICDKRKKVRL